MSKKLLLSGVLLTMLSGIAFSANTLGSAGHYGTVRSQSADLLGFTTLQIGGAFHYGQEWEYIHSISPDQKRSGSPGLLSGVGYIGFGLAPILDLGINLPAYYDKPNFGDLTTKGIGDLEVSLKLSAFPLQNEKKFASAALYMGFQFPTGDKDEGYFPRHPYYVSEGKWSCGEVLFHPLIATTLHFDRLKGNIPLRLNLNFGGIFNAPGDNNALNGAIALEYMPHELLTFFAEVSAEERIKSVSQENFFRDLINDPIFVTPGVKFTIPKTTLSIIVAGDFGISESDKYLAQTSVGENGTTISHQSAPLYNVYFGLNFLIDGKRDRDRDGIKGKADLCPDMAEDMDGFEDTDGCPDFDNDKDGIPDSLDNCPDQAGIAENKGCPDVDTDNDGIVDRLDKCADKAGIPENNGCPDVDTDNDGVVDRLDKCPELAGVKENEGCPDVDTDKDGVVDRLDKCPDDAEDIDNFQDDDGCPDPDNDGDGILDVNDKCPNNPGTVATEGCPKTKEITRGALVLKGVNFASGKAVLLASSYKVLDEIAESLREWPEVRVEVQGHTDNTGAAELNQTLSQERASAVREYLVNKGITPDRLTATGYGQNRPVGSNKTAAGRAKNRRVELNRID